MPARTLHTLIGIFLIVSEAAYLMLYAGGSTQVILFLVASIIASTCYLLVCLLVRNHPALPRFMLLIILGAGLVYRITLIGTGPVLSGDVYRYVWDGKVAAHGYNPYAYAPVDPALAHLHSGLLPGALEFAEMPAIYPPFSEWVFAASYMLFGEQPAGIKLFLLAADALSVLLLLLLLRETGKPESYVAFYVLCPLPIMQSMVDAHVDVLAFPALLLALLFWHGRREMVSMAALAGSILFKLLPAILIPAFWRHANGTGKKIAVVVLPAALTALVYLPYILWDGAPFIALGAYSARWYFNGLIFDGVLAIVGNNEAAHLIMIALFGAWMLFVLWRPMELFDRVYWIMMGFFLLSATVHPWYITWLAVLLPVAFHWSGAAWLATISLANIVYIDYLGDRVWHLPVGWELLEYAPVAVLAGWEIYRLWKVRVRKVVQLEERLH